MSFLRRISTLQLVGVCAAVIAVAIGATTIASALSGGGPVPKPRKLAPAIRAALSTPAPDGITARVQFTNHLIDTGSLQGAGGNPLLTGASGRLWLSSSQHRLRLEFQSSRGDSELLVSDGKASFYDQSSNTLYSAALPKRTPDATPKASEKAAPLPSLAEIQKALTRLSQHFNVNGPIPGDIANRPSYSVRISPRHDGGLLGAAELSWDAIRGIPLRVGIYAHGNSAPVLELKVTKIRFSTPDASVFAIEAPANANLVNVAAPAGKAAGLSARRASAKHHGARPAVLSGLAAVEKALPFKLIAPDALVGLPRQDVRQLDFKGSRAALGTYGQGFGAVVVIERPVKPAGTAATTGPAAATGTAAGARRDKAKDAGGGREGNGQLSLPTVTINGASGQELVTALGTLITFKRDGVSYTVIGSISQSVAEKAAQALK